MSEKRDAVINVLEHGVDVKNRRIYFGSCDPSGSDFTWRSVERVIRLIQVMEIEASKKPIELHMSSPGGCPYELLRLYDAIQASPCQIKFFGGGQICSAATWIMAGCDERYLFPNAQVLIHDSGSYDYGFVPPKLTDTYIAIEQERRMQDRLNQIYADNSRMPKEFWEEFVKRDLWLTAEETITLGLADKIIEPQKRGNLRRTRMAALGKTPAKKDLSKLLRSLATRSYANRLDQIELQIPKEQFDNEIVVESEEEKSGS